MALVDGDEATTACKRDALGRVKVPKAQREALLDEFERSNLSGGRMHIALNKLARKNIPVWTHDCASIENRVNRQESSHLKNGFP
jgi:hypothetical protein